MVQNAAARLLTGTLIDHNLPILHSLQCLLIFYRLDFKFLLFVFKALNGLDAKYLSDLLNLNNSARSLMSSQQRLLMVPRCKLKSRGDQAFSIVVPKLWNPFIHKINLHRV